MADNVSTYDSGGAGSLPGGGNPDYSDLGTWEGDTGNDLVTSTTREILDCYDSQDHTQNVNIDTATTSTNYYRYIRDASGSFNGTAGSGVCFDVTGLEVVYFLQTDEDYFRIKDIEITGAVNYSSMAFGIRINTADHCKIINVLVHDLSNSNVSNTTRAFRHNNNGANNVFINCIAYDCDSTHFSIYGGASTRAFVISCTSIDSPGHGIWGYNEQVIWNCYSTGSSTSDYLDEARISSSSGWNASGDNSSDHAGRCGNNYYNSIDLTSTSPFAGVAQLDVDYLVDSDIEYPDMHWAASNGAKAGRSFLNDLTETYDPDNFLTTEAVCFKDIAGNQRATAADMPFYVGASQPGPLVSRYDSGASKEYSSLSTWETESQGDYSDAGIWYLLCDSGTHDDNVSVVGATNTDATNRRCIMTDPDATTPFAGKSGTGACFEVTSDVGNFAIELTEPYIQMKEICVKYAASNDTDCRGIGSDGTYAGIEVIRCVAYECEETSGNNQGIGFYSGANVLFFSCLARNNNIGFKLEAGSGESSGAVCCTGLDNFYNFYEGNDGSNYVWSCLGQH